jgi:hypothetical protein
MDMRHNIISAFEMYLRRVLQSFWLFDVHVGWSPVDGRMQTETLEQI